MATPIATPTCLVFPSLHREGGKGEGYVVGVLHLCDHTHEVLGAKYGMIGAQLYRARQRVVIYKTLGS